MTCLQVKSLLDDYIDQGLDETNTKAVKKHLALCLTCQAEYQAAMRLVQLLGDYTAPDPGDEYFKEVTSLIIARASESNIDASVRMPDADLRQAKASFRRSLLAVAASLLLFFSALALDFSTENGLPLGPGFADANGPKAADRTTTPLLELEKTRQDVSSHIMVLSPPGLMGNGSEWALVMGID